MAPLIDAGLRELKIKQLKGCSAPELGGKITWKWVEHKLRSRGICGRGESGEVVEAGNDKAFGKD